MSEDHCRIIDVEETPSCFGEFGSKRECGDCKFDYDCYDIKLEIEFCEENVVVTLV